MMVRQHPYTNAYEYRYYRLTYILTIHLKIVLVISTCKVIYKSYDTFDLKHENLSVFKAAYNRAETTKAQFRS